MDNRIRLRIMGISYNPVRSGAFALLLADEEGEKRIPILIGASEAQAIGIKMQGVIPPRPMTHDLFCSLGQAFGIQLEEVFIYRFEDGIFSSGITFRDREGKEAVLDARTSDAVAIAVRVGAPIYTTPEILERAGLSLEECITEDLNKDPEDRTRQASKTESQDPDEMSDEQLEALLEQLTRDEEYEEAARINSILRQRRKDK